jgi:hypothetical protein
MGEPSNRMQWADGELVGMERERGWLDGAKDIAKVCLAFLDEAVILLLLAYAAYRFFT